MSEKKTTYESLDNRIASASVTKDLALGLEVVDGHAIKAVERTGEWIVSSRISV